MRPQFAIDATTVAMIATDTILEGRNVTIVQARGHA
jgi:hypothetical protein